MEETSYVLNHEISTTAEEAFKVLRANIHFCEVNKKLKSIALTSYGQGEGKSTISLHLAISMAKANMNVLYVDADMRKPLSFKQIVSSNLKGLTNYLSGQASLDEIINKTNIDGLSCITCGSKSSNPGELILGPVFTKFMEEVTQLYDIVIVDTPPLGSVIDGAIIAAHTDGTIYVIEANKVKCKNALMAKEQLKKANVNILGVVLNKVQKTDYKSYYGNYDYYGTKKPAPKNQLIKSLRKRGQP